jgi:hypothetical protein
MWISGVFRSMSSRPERGGRLRSGGRREMSLRGNGLGWFETTKEFGERASDFFFVSHILMSSSPLHLSFFFGDDQECKMRTIFEHS